MSQAKLSSKFQLSIPKEIREEMTLEAGQQFTILTRGNIIELIPTICCCIVLTSTDALLVLEAVSSLVNICLKIYSNDPRPAIKINRESVPRIRDSRPRS